MATVSWGVRGTYFESCNCDAICPCRRINGVPGGRSTHGECEGVLSWVIDDGDADGVDLSGLPVAISFHYSDDEPGCPWTWILHLDQRASSKQRVALEAIFTGRLGGDAAPHFQWIEDEVVEVRVAEISVDHTPRRQWLRVRDQVRVLIRDRYPGHDTVTCVIPGHEQAGEELVADELVVKTGPFDFSYNGVCGYAAAFDYSG
jgi:hypothetical protein